MLAGLAFLLCLFLPAPRAGAAFTICNQTLDVVNVAVGQETGGVAAEDETWKFQTEGWWTVGANQCVNVIREDLVNRYIYVYATDVFWQPILSGTTDMCIESRRFAIRGIHDCWQRGHQAAKFIEVDTLEQARWTLFLTTFGP
ncbi:DUF1036 domain-containing protein [Chelativorans sp. AA-79]|uniref:DUF1036 domain-containing protein n=1 Tax=Chelativorans sp. AA-79 TaxID=3028735 RepID=UPI0023F6D287|nr:DUF1036 domain-containing protein [Chelativorans sp. AA-79]WEX11837.1 DUF1036 domain-containing protein [Chelativorans sp. AA-79]